MLFAGILDLVNKSKPSGFGGFCFISASRDASYRFPVRFISNNPGVSEHFRCDWHLSLFETVPSTPISWLALQECPNGSQIAFVTEEIRFLFAF